MILLYLLKLASVFLNDHVSKPMSCNNPISSASSHSSRVNPSCLAIFIACIHILTVLVENGIVTYEMKDGYKEIKVSMEKWEKFFSPSNKKSYNARGRHLSLYHLGFITHN